MEINADCGHRTSNRKYTSLPSMSDLSTPRTPKPEHAMRRDNASPLHSLTVARKTSKSNRRLASPVRDTGTMTPPPSSQVPKSSSKSSQAGSTSRREHTLASPPATLKPSPPISSGNLFGEIPSLETVHEMDEGQLRGLVTELLPAFGEARVSAAHSKLQHSLLSIETEEAAKRAAVEQEATRREVQVLQEGSPVHRSSFSPRSPQALMQRNLQLALAHCRDLQLENAVLEKRLRSSKKMIVQLDGQNADLKESVHLLRQRIKENRDHLTEMQSTGAISINSTPVMDYSTPLHNRTPKTPATVSRPPREPKLTVGSQDPFDALILAGQVMNGEANSVPSSPHQARAKRLHPHHIRGAHSLSSLPTTPQRSRPMTADDALTRPYYRANLDISFSAPSTQLPYAEKSRAQEDRESTISASDGEEDAYSDENLPGSQASQMATDMLRHSLGPQGGNDSAPCQVPESSKLMQAKLFGHIAKPGIDGVKSSKRGADSSPHSDLTRNSKRARVAHAGTDKIGLGIKA